jgi:cytochrome oxidase assembly protein ShyY1
MQRTSKSKSRPKTTNKTYDKEAQEKEIRTIQGHQKDRELNYQLELSQEMRNKNIHNTLHINLLTRSPKDTIPDRIPTQPPLIEVDSEEEWEVEQILKSKIQNRVLQYLVKWKGVLTSENTWEPVRNITNHQTKSGNSIKHTQKPLEGSTQLHSSI